MSQLEQLKLFVNARLTAAAEEILGAVERAMLEFHRDVLVSDGVRRSELLTLAEALKQEEVEVFTAATQEVSLSVTEASGQVVKQDTLRPEFLKNKECRPTRDIGRLQNLLQGEAVACLKFEQSTESSYYQSQTVASTAGELVFPHASTASKKTEEEADGCGGLDFCQPISSDSGAENETTDTEWMESRGSNSYSTTAKSKTRAKQRLNSRSLRKRRNSFCCKPCGESFHCRSSLMIHVKSHANSSPILCPSNHAASEEGALQPLEAHKEDNLCHICGKTFTTRTHLKRHMLIHTGQKPHCCKECGRRFARVECLRVHMRIHTVERPYTCQVCEKGFRQRGNLISHMRKHTGEKPYRCGVCARPFSYKKDMMRHAQVHTKT